MLLAASIASLLIGPLLFQMTRVGSRTLGFIEGFAFITICGLLCFGILPPAIAAGGYGAWVFVMCGLAFPVALEKLFHQLARQVHLIILILGIAGLAVHAAIDGVVLAASDAHAAEVTDAFWRLGHLHEGEYLALAVVLLLGAWLFEVPIRGSASRSGTCWRPRSGAARQSGCSEY